MNIHIVIWHFNEQKNGLLGIFFRIFAIVHYCGRVKIAGSCFRTCRTQLKMEICMDNSSIERYNLAL